MKKTLTLAAKYIFMAIAALLVLAAVFLVVMNLAKFAIYPDYYAIKTDVCKNPGLNDGFICQGVCAHEESGKIFVSGYMMDESASRIYVTDTDDNSYYVTLSLDGEAFKGHAGGIASRGDEVYVVCSRAIHVIAAQDLLTARNGDDVRIKEVIGINNTGSSAYADEQYLYVGEFYNSENDAPGRAFDTPGGRYNAIIGRYRLDDLTAPDQIYAIPNKVQGVCFTQAGEVILSTSYGLADSRYYVYDESEAIDSGLMLDGAPVLYLCDAKKVVKGPAMAEGIDEYEGRIMTLTESASNKYIFGKFFFADQIVALDLAGE